MTITDALRRFTIDDVGVPAAKVETIHYGLDDLPQAWGENPPDAVDGRILLSTSRLVPQKGIDVAIRALPELPEYTLVVLGEGPERARLESLADELGVRGRLFLPGRVPDSPLAQLAHTLDSAAATGSNRRDMASVFAAAENLRMLATSMASSAELRQILKPAVTSRMPSRSSART